MKKSTKIALISTLAVAVITPTAYFSTTKIMHDVKIKNGKTSLIQYLKDNDSYNVKSMNVKYNNTALNHTFEFSLKDVNIDVITKNEMDLNAIIDIKYDYNTIFNGEFTLKDNIFYVQSYNSNIIHQNIKFDYDDLKKFIDTYQDSAFVDDHFDFDLDFSFIDQLNDNLVEIPTLDDSIKTFSYPLDKYNSSIIFITDNDYSLKKMKTSSAMQKANELITFSATNIVPKKSAEIETPEDEFKSVSPLLNGFDSIFEKFNKRKGKGISLHLGDVKNSIPVTIRNKNVALFDLLGQMDIYYDPKFKDDISFRYQGSLMPYGIKIPTKNLVLDIIFQNGIFYVTQDLIKFKGSIKLETIEEIFDVSRNDFAISINSVFFNALDLIGINAKLNPNYCFVDSIDVNEDLIKAKLNIPTTLEEEVDNNKVFGFEIQYKEKKFDTLKFDDFSYGNVGFNNMQIKVNEDMEKKPIINPKDYKEYDQTVKDLFGK